jgi:hypothetical protein
MTKKIREIREKNSRESFEQSDGRIPGHPANGIKITSVKSVKIYSREARLSAKINHPQIFLVLFCGFFPCNFAAVIIDNDAK